MAQPEHQTKESETMPSQVAISYRGSPAKIEAEALSLTLQGSGLTVTDLTELDEGEPLLGASEIIITVVLAPIAHAAAKAIISTTLAYVRDYFVARVQKGGVNMNAQLLIKEADGGKDKSIPFSLRGATAETIKHFFENVDKSILKS